MIEIRDLCKSYGTNIIYNHFNITFEENHITGIMGESGGGKTTLLKIISGIEKYDEGEIRGINNKKIAYIFQEDRLIPWLTVYENIRFVLKSYKDEKYIYKKVKEVLTKLRLWEYKEYLPEHLSGGMQRRVSLGRALVYDCEILLMDEPFKGLDEELKKDIVNYFLKEYKERPKTIIWVTHDEEELKEISHKIYWLEGKPLVYKIKK